MRDVIIFGAGGHGKVVADIIEKEVKYNLVGFLDGVKPVGEQFFGYEILGDESFLKNNKVFGGIVAIGDNWVRSIISNKILDIDPNFEFINAVHTSAQIGKGVKFGKGNVVMANAIINSDASVGDNCIINSKASVGHDVKLSNYVTVAPGSVIGGNTYVGDFSTVSLGANVIHGITIGEHTVIGAGSTVLNDIGAYSVAYGTPAKVVRNRKESDKYL